MFDVTRAVLNNINQIKYLKNQNKVTYEKVVPNNTMAPYKIEGNKEMIFSLQTSYRKNNLRCFLKNYAIIRGRRFVLISLPAILSASAIAFAFTPSRVNEEDKATKYIEEEKLYKSDEGVLENSKEVYYLNDNAEIFGHRLIEPNVEARLGSASNQIDVKIHDGESCIYGSVSIKDNGEMSVTDIESVTNYFDLDEYRGIDFQSVDEEYYEKLFDRIVDLFKSSGYINPDEKEMLDALVASDKKIIIIKILTYNYEESVDVLLSKTRLPRKIILALCALIYDILSAIFFTYVGNDLKRLKLDKYKNSFGQMYVEHAYEYKSLWEAMLNIKDAFLQAETERIERLYEEIEKNVCESDRKKLLTNYEKKLIQKKRVNIHED